MFDYAGFVEPADTRSTAFVNHKNVPRARALLQDHHKQIRISDSEEEMVLKQN